jgi:rod shape-determining protein MreD
LIRSENLRTFLYGIGIVTIQVVLLRHLKIFGGEADLVLLFLLWLCLRRPRRDCLIYAAFLGLLQDAMIDLWGLNMFSKTLLVLLLYTYLNRISHTKFIFWQVFLIILASSFLHNSIFYGVSLFSELFSSAYMVWSLLVAGTIFTAFLGSFLYLVRDDI